MVLALSLCTLQSYLTMQVEYRKLLQVLPLIIIYILNAAECDDSAKQTRKSKLADVRDEEVLRQLKQKKLVNLLVSKPDDCQLLSEKNDEVQVHYTGYLETGEIFDSSEKSGKDAITFTLGTGQVIKGWDEGLLNMCQGEKRRLIIPPHLGYGKVGFPPVIPADATLLFEVTLVSLNKQSFGGSFADPQSILQFVKLLFFPALVLYVFYYLYKRYKAEEAKTGKEQKYPHRGRNSRKKN
jgi:FK506-binding protein 2